MIKKFLLLSLVVSQLTISCSSDDDNNTEDPTTPDKELTLEEEIANIIKQPYSSLPPEQQKIKLEAEANDMLVQLDKTKSSSAIEAIENLLSLLSENAIDIFDGKNDNEIEDILNMADVYGVYTWNNTNKSWSKTASTTELKFVFPAKSSQSTNNAIFTAKSVASNIKVKITDSNGNWQYNEETNEWVLGGYVNDYMFLPTSSDATLTIDNTQVATFAQTASYNGNEAPVDFTYKMTLNDGYSWDISGKKAAQNNTAKAVFTYNGKNLVSFTAGSTTDIDALLTDDELTQYRGKGNGLVQILDNFVIIADMDLAAEAIDDAALENIPYPAYPDYSSPNADFKGFFTARNAYEKKYSEGSAANFNKNIKLTLISRKDGSKIADIVQVAEKDGGYYDSIPVWVPSEWYENGGYWSNNQDSEQFFREYYTENYYLNFKDNTQVAMSVYFSEGFDDLLDKFDDFINRFEKK